MVVVAAVASVAAVVVVAVAVTAVAAAAAVVETVAVVAVAGTVTESRLSRDCFSWRGPAMSGRAFVLQAERQAHGRLALGGAEAGERTESGVATRYGMEDHITVEGRIVTVLPGTMFRVQLDNDHEVLAVISGKMRKRWVRLTAGDRVRMEMSPYDLGKARIVWRVG